MNDCAGKMDKEVLWTDLVGNLKEGPKGPYWELRDSHLKHWSLQIIRKDRASPFLLTFVYRVDKSWIPNPGNPIKLASVGARDTLNVAVLEGVEERVVSIDCKKHRFHLEPFSESVSSLPSQDKEELERVMVSGVSKKAINFILETLGEINAREAADREESRRQMKQQAETILKPRPHGGTSKQRTPRAPKGSQKSTDIDRAYEAKKSKTVAAEVVPFSAPVEPITNPPRDTSGARRQPAPRRAVSPEKKSKKQKSKTTEAPEETPLVLTQAEKGRVITHGEEPSLEEAAADRKKFRQLFGHLYPFGVEAVFHVNIKKMKSAKSYQVKLYGLKSEFNVEVQDLILNRVCGIVFTGHSSA